MDVITDAKEERIRAAAEAGSWASRICAWTEAIDFCTDGDAEMRDLICRGPVLCRSLEARAVLREHGYDGTNREETREAIEATAREAVLSVDVRSGWRTAGDAWDGSKWVLEAEEFQILLSTGGPAVRIVGDLGLCNQAEAPRLEHQDWGTPWTEWKGDCPKAGAPLQPILETFCGLFFFGE